MTLLVSSLPNIFIMLHLLLEQKTNIPPDRFAFITNWAFAYGKMENCHFFILLLLHVKIYSVQP